MTAGMKDALIITLILATITGAATVLIRWGMIMQCAGVERETAYPTRWGGMGVGCLVNVGGRWVPLDQWRVED